MPRVYTHFGYCRVILIMKRKILLVEVVSYDWSSDSSSEFRKPPGPGGGGGHCLFEGRYPKQNSRPPVLCYHSPLSLSLLVYSPLFLRHQRKAYCYYCCYSGLPPVDIIFSCPDTITLITVVKTLIIANPGCFPWTSQANNNSPNRKCPSESSWVRDSPPLFLAYSHNSRSPFCSGYPKPG